jgi:hypothetical protein
MKKLILGGRICDERWWKLMETGPLVLEFFISFTVVALIDTFKPFLVFKWVSPNLH